LNRKWDPGDAPGRTINMTAFRAAAAVIGTSPPVPQEDPIVKNLIIGKATGSAAIWVGDGVFRRQLADMTEVNGLQGWINSKGGDPTIHPFDDLRVLGTPLAVMVGAGFGSLTEAEVNILAAVRAQPTGGQVGPEQIAQLIAALKDALPHGVTPQQITAAVRVVFAGAGEAARDSSDA
jgi:hypothetical protein